MKVYLVATGCYSDYGIDAVFLDEKLAETFAERLRRAGHTAEVDERIVLDEIPEWQPCWIWSCTVRNGEVLASTPAPMDQGHWLTDGSTPDTARETHVSTHALGTSASMPGHTTAISISGAVREHVEKAYHDTVAAVRARHLGIG